MTLALMTKLPSSPLAGDTGCLPIRVADTPGWLHPAPGSRGVVLLGALDYEALCTWRPLFSLAERLAAAGCPTLRLDYPGHGESAAPDPGAQTIEAAVAAVRAGIDFLKARAGVTEILVMGLRFGALVAALAAQGRPDIAGLALLAPPASGRAYLRSLTVQAHLLAEGRASESAEGELDIAGFRLSAASQAAIKAAKLPAEYGVQRLLVLDPGLEAEGRSATTAPDGRLVERLPFAGYGQLMQNPTLALAPAAFDDVVAWASTGRPSGHGWPVQAEPVLLNGAAWQEEVVRFGEAGQLAGTFCRPHQTRRDAPAALIVGSGRNPRAGWAGSAVRLARALAAEGIASLRYDTRGIGDSAAAPHGVEPLYSTLALEDAGEAVALLEARGLDRILIVGPCSGAWTAFHAALANPRIVGLVAVNLQRFIWTPGESLTVAMRQSVRPSAFYGRQLLTTATWKRLMAGEIDLPAIAAGLTRRWIGRPLARLGQALAVGLGLNNRATRVRRWMDKLEARGVRILFIDSEGDPSLAERAYYFGAAPGRLARHRNVRELLIADADHDLTSHRARTEADAAIRALAAALCRPMNGVTDAASTRH